MVDAVGSEIDGSAVVITYRYNPNLATTDVNNLAAIGVEVCKNVSSDFVIINTEKQTSFDLIDINGKILETRIIQSGESTFDISNKSTGIYFLNFKTENGKKGVCKIIKV